MTALIRRALVVFVALVSVSYGREAEGLDLSSIGVLTASTQAQSARVSGHVRRTDTGAPVEAAVVTLASTGGALPRTVKTDAFGAFEFDGLPAGEFRVTVQAPGFVSADATVAQPGGIGRVVSLSPGRRDDRVHLLVAPMGAIEGTISDEAGNPAFGVAVVASQMRFVAGKRVLMPALGGSSTGRTDASGRYRISDLPPGDYYVVAMLDSTGSSDPRVMQGPTEPGEIATYFPGTARALDARPVRVEIGRDAFDVTFRLATEPVVKVHGVVRDRTGNPVPNARLLFVRLEDGEIRSNFGILIATSDGSGAFAHPGVPAGSYVLQALAGRGFGAARVTVQPMTPEFPGAEVTVHSRVRARGHLVFEGDAPPSKDQLQIMFVPTDFVSGPSGSTRIPIATLHDNWTFQLDDLAWTGTIRVRAPAGWAMRQMTVSGRDITDVPYDFRSTDVDGIEIVMTSRLASIHGTVTDEAGRPVAAASVVVFAEDPATYVFPSGFGARAQAAPNGIFTVIGLLAGRYRIIAVPVGQSISPDWLSAVRPFATSVTLAEGEAASLALRLIRR